MKVALLVFLLVLSGCATAPAGPRDSGAPSPDDERLQQTIQASEKGPSRWSPAVTIPLSPVLLVADTAVKFGVTSYYFVRALFGGSGETTPVPERVERQAEQIPKY